MLLLDYLQSKYPTAKRQTLKRMVEQRRIIINGRPADRLKLPVSEADQIQIIERPLPKPALSIRPLRIIHEDPDILVILKPAGLLTSTTARERRPTAISIIRAYLAEREPRARAGIIHRLDRDASGLLVFSKNHAAYEALKQQFFRHTVERIYTAVVRGAPNPPSGRIESSLVELADGSVRSTALRGKGQLAITHYQVLQQEGELSLLQVTLETGRKHQIRTHLAQRGHPIVGDAVYGADGETKRSLLLAATRLSIDHPRTGQRVAFEVPPPPQIRRLFKQSPAPGAKNREIPESKKAPPA